MAWKKRAKNVYINTYAYSECLINKSKRGWGVLCSMKASPFGTGAAANDERDKAATLKAAKNKATKMAKRLQKKRARYYSIRD